MVTLHHGDCRLVLPGLEADSIDAVVTDPPYHLTPSRASGEIGWPSWNDLTKQDRTGRKAGFMGKTWDGGGVAFDPATWAEVLRVMKPGAHLVAFGGTRTSHRMVCAIEDAGFEVRDTIAWLYGSGFPKSHNIGKAIDRMAGAEREVVGQYGQGFRAAKSGLEGWQRPAHAIDKGITAPATPEAAAWEGWGTALKPAFEPIVLVRKPLSEPTVAANVLRWGTGALNVDGCRVEGEIRETAIGGMGRKANPIYGKFAREDAPYSYLSTAGRWPANLAHDGSDEVLAAFDLFGERTSGAWREGMRQRPTVGVAKGAEAERIRPGRRPEGGSAARFFYSAKADATDRCSSKHPTVKPLALMRWLVRLVTPPGGLVLDPFAGTGVTWEAALLEGCRAVLIEQDATYCADIRRRLGRPAGADTPLFAAL